MQTKHVISDEAVVGEWLEPAVRKVIEEAGEDCDANVLATACTMKWCFMPKTKALRQRLMEQPIAYGERMVALAKRILGDGAADEQVEDLATAIRAAADALLLEKTDMAAAPPATAPEPAVEPLPQDSSTPEDRRRVLRQAKVRGEAKKLLAGQLRRANLDDRSVYEDWDVDAEERDAKPKGAPRGRNAGTGEEQVEHKLAAAERKAAAAEGEAPPPKTMVATFTCKRNGCGKQLTSVKQLGPHRTGKACVPKPEPKEAVPVNELARAAPVPPRHRHA